MREERGRKGREAHEKEACARQIEAASERIKKLYLILYSMGQYYKLTNLSHYIIIMKVVQGNKSFRNKYNTR